MKKLIIAVSVILVSVSCFYPGQHMMDWGHMPYGYGGIIMWIILLVLIGVIVYLISNKGKLVEHDEETPLEILKKRYAKGEISKQEFEKMKRDVE